MICRTWIGSHLTPGTRLLLGSTLTLVLAREVGRPFTIFGSEPGEPLIGQGWRVGLLSGLILLTAAAATCPVPRE